MGFELKHYAFLTVLICSGWALIISASTSVDELSNIELRSELPREENSTKFGENPIDNSFEAVVKMLNTALPLSLLAIVLLLVTYGANPIGLGSLGFAIVLFVFSSSRAMHAADVINASTNFSLDAQVWWM